MISKTSHKTTKYKSSSAMMKFILFMLATFMISNLVLLENSVDAETQAEQSQLYLDLPKELSMPVDLEIPMELEPFNPNQKEETQKSGFSMRLFSLEPKSDEPEWASFTGKAGTVSIFYTETGTSASTYIANGTYNGVVPILAKGTNRYKIAVAGAVGWVEKTHVKLTSFDEANSYNYYELNSSNEFVHRISPNADGYSVSEPFYQGGTPKNVKSNETYFSFDGHYFYPATKQGLNTLISDYNANHRNNSINPNNPFYNYFQFLPIKSQSNLTAQDFRNYYPSSYRNPKTSKMYNMEQLFIDHSNIQATNAAIVFSTGVHESAYGTSGFAKWRNNFFGHSAYDSSPGLASVYATPSFAIGFHSNTLIRWNYSDVMSSSHYRGGILGNKELGMNMVYASDPYWGEKIANHYYLLDKRAGFKDLNQYTIGIIKSDSVNIRKDASTNAGIVYQNKYQGIPIAIIEEKTGTTVNGSNKWYGFTSESLLNENKDLQEWISNNQDIKMKRFDIQSSTVYIHSSYVDIVSTGTNSQIKTQPNPTIKPYPVFIDDAKTIYTLTDLNLRTDNSTDYEPLLTIPAGTKIPGAELTSDGWLMVQYEDDKDADHIGFISAQHASYTKGGKPIIESSGGETPKPENPNKIGDLNGDGILTVGDLRIIHRHLTGTEIMRDDLLKTADLNGDGIITVGDLRIIHRHLTGAEKIEGW